ncbi:hypothetical protein [Amycolatopsis sp. NPDC021455]|uniref:hypothetical protein n=1 Tax=Amycolatopsis sp. NPDC021455 TaxID=3154901 RepID=UPI0033CEF79E
MTGTEGSEIQTEPATLEDLDRAVAEVEKAQTAVDEARAELQRAKDKHQEALKAAAKARKNRADVLRRLGPSYGARELGRRADMKHQQVSRVMSNPDAT